MIEFELKGKIKTIPYAKTEFNALNFSDWVKNQRMDLLKQKKQLEPMECEKIMIQIFHTSPVDQSRYLQTILFLLRFTQIIKGDIPKIVINKTKSKIEDVCFIKLIGNKS